jgi:hypothetical protein
VDDDDERGTFMLKIARTLAATVLLATSVASYAGAASALPIGGLAMKNATPSAVETVRWRGRGWGWGGVAAGLAAGAIIGGALASPYYYPGPYYAPPPPAYYGPAYAPPAAGDAVAYCMQRFRSYDPASGTYLGYDGLRHPCP